jgi:hypothetical protein
MDRQETKTEQDAGGEKGLPFRGSHELLLLRLLSFEESYLKNYRNPLCAR